ncbi:hypothetical protein WJX74_006219 [Apatococcus lobatus]|uniref:tRNA:m(4)X modification enzyme TRM13 n=1 Tax=Apatococcus lobatus TaxID=904363 RepID=A0AAW1RF17_9CHLO
MADLCKYLLPHKGRTCRLKAAVGQRYCGEHLYFVTAQGRKRVVCPVAPSHSVWEDELPDHVNTCSFLKVKQRSQGEPCYHLDFNAGHPPGGTIRPLSSADRSKVADQLGLSGLQALLQRIEAAHCQACSPSPAQRVLCPERCQALIEGAGRPDQPYSEKHARQQASIVGNMQQFSLTEIPACAYIEFGAGKGYLSSMLADTTDVQTLALVDSQSFRFKADRFLIRKANLTLERQRQDIKDFDPAGLSCLCDSTGWVAFGKHLCGAATDFTLRCCLSSLQQKQDAQYHDNLSASTSRQQDQAKPNNPYGNLPGQEPAEQQRASHSAGSNGYHASPDKIPGSEAAGQDRLHHHLPDVGLNAARCGPTSADSSKSAGTLPVAQLPDESQSSIPTLLVPEQLLEDARKLSIPAETCSGTSAPNGAEQCNHISAASQPSLKQVLIGHQSAASSGDKEGPALLAGRDVHSTSALPSLKPVIHEPADSNSTLEPLARGPGTASKALNKGVAIATCCHHRCSWNQYVHPEFFLEQGFTAQEFELISWMAAWALCGHETPAGCDASMDASVPDPNPPALALAAAGHPARQLPRPKRIAIGQMCKQLIDQGRLTWLRKFHYQAEMVLYVDAAISGENRLLLAKPTAS